VDASGFADAMTLHRRAFIRGLSAASLAAGSARAAASRLLQVATFPDLDRAAALAVPAFERAHPGVRVRLTILAYADFPTAMVTALAAGANLPDLMAMDREIVGQLADSAGLHDLSAAPFQAGQRTGEMVPFALAAGHSRTGSLTAFPVDIGPGCLFYRSDLLQQADLQESDLTASWADFIRCGKRLKARHNGYLVAHAGDIADVVVRSGLRPGDGVYFSAAGRPLVREERFEQAFNWAARARQAGIDARVTAWSNEWAEGLRRGRIASQMFGGWFGGHLANWIAPKAAGLWRCAPLPAGSYASWGGSYYAIPRRAREPALAWDFLRALALDPAQQLRAFTALDAFPALATAHSDPLFEQPVPYFGGQRARQLWREASLRIPAVDADRHDRLARDVMQAALERVLEHGDRIGDVLADAERRILRRARIPGSIGPT
jgi:multiple sugar transport system substrate-binding protein